MGLKYRIREITEEFIAVNQVRDDCGLDYGGGSASVEIVSIYLEGKVNRISQKRVIKDDTKVSDLIRL